MASSHNPSKRFRHFAFTSFEDEAPTLDSRPGIQYMVVGKEVCPTTGKDHWQCHLYLKNAISQEAAHKKFKPWHIEPSVAPLESIKYCKKDGQFKEYGHFNQGARNDLKALADDIMAGKRTVEDILIEDPETYHMFGRTLNALEDAYKKRQKRTAKPDCLWLYSPTGVGKTRQVHEKEPSLYVYPYEKNGWWDGYEGQEAVLFDDFRKQLPVNEILRICDHYQFAVPRRGRAPVPLLAKRIYFTSCKSMDELFVDAGENLAQLHRRIESKFIDGLGLLTQ